MAKVFFDTNLFIDALTESARPEDQGKRARTLQLLEELSHTEDIVTSLQVVNKCHYVLHRKLALPEELVRQAVHGGVLSIATVLPMGLDDYHEACRLRATYALSYWDSLICASALRVGAQTLYSEDMHNGLTIDSRLRIVNPLTDQAR